MDITTITLLAGGALTVVPACSPGGRPGQPTAPQFGERSVRRILCDESAGRRRVGGRGGPVSDVSRRQVHRHDGRRECSRAAASVTARSSSGPSAA